MPIKKLRPNFSFTQDRIEQLKAVVPEAFADGKINFDSLREALGEYLEDQGHPEAEHGSTELAEVFGLFWPGKREARRLATLPSKGTLVPAAGEGIDEDKTRNIFIEGENLEVLKLLQKSYAGRIKMIYIDPPYNTGNDFVYKDDFKEPLEEYLKRTGQADENGKLLTTNTKAGGRFHSNWLSMIYPRLCLVRNLLREDGAIFISIDEKEFQNLRVLCNEVFGEECFIAALTVLCNPKGRSQDKYFATNHEYVLVYAKSVLPKGFFAIAKDEDQIETEYPEEDEGGKYRLLELRNTHREFGKHNRRNLFYPLFTNDDGEVFLTEVIGFHKVLPIWDDGFEGCWTWDRSKAERDISLLTGQYVGGRWKIYRKSYASGSDRMLKTILAEKSYFTERGQKEFNSLFGSKTKLFLSPKSPFLLADLIRSSTSGSDITLDFFAGSCSMAQAVLDLNREDGGNRRFIMVQLPEPTPDDSPAQKAGYETIAEIGKERIRRVISKMKKENNGKSSSKRETPEDLGFKVFKLARSNFKAWQDYDGENIQELEKLFDQTETPLVKGWKEDDLLTEIMLQQGFPLDSKIARQSGFKSNKVQLIESEACSHRLFVCLDPKIKEDTIKHLELRTEDIFVCLDTALTDQAKMRLADICNLGII